MVGIHLTGELNGWATPKDLILHLAGKLTVRVSAQTCLRGVSVLKTSREERVVSWNILAQVSSISHAQVSIMHNSDRVGH